MSSCICLVLRWYSDWAEFKMTSIRDTLSVIAAWCNANLSCNDFNSSRRCRHTVNSSRNLASSASEGVLSALNESSINDQRCSASSNSAPDNKPIDPAFDCAASSSWYLYIKTVQFIQKKCNYLLLKEKNIKCSLSREVSFTKNAKTQRHNSNALLKASISTFTNNIWGTCVKAPTTLCASRSCRRSEFNFGDRLSKPMLPSFRGQ